MTDQPTVTKTRRALVQSADAYHEQAKAYSSARQSDGAAFDAWCAYMTAANFANVIAAMLRRQQRQRWRPVSGRPSAAEHEQRLGRPGRRLRMGRQRVEPQRQRQPAFLIMNATTGNSEPNTTYDTTTETTMTDTRHPGLITPDNAPRLADLDDDTTPHPSQITVFCDDCGVENTADYLVPADSTSADRLEIARDHMRTQLGWSCDEAGDYCPECA